MWLLDDPFCHPADASDACDEARGTGDVLVDVADRYSLPVLAPPIPRTVRFAEASASGSSVMAGRKNKGAAAYGELAAALLKHWKSGKPLPTFTVEV